MRELFDPDLLKYCTEHSTQPDELLRDLERETNLSTVTPQMIAGPYQGKLIEMIVRLKGAKRALEVGTFTGYAAICIARGLFPGGQLHTIEINPERESLIRKYLTLAQVEGCVNLHIGNAFEVIPEINGSFDFIFIDAGKRDNEAYFDLLLPRLEHGGLMLLDNVLWGGKVVEEPDDADAQSIMHLNDKIAADKSIECMMLPIRDGITIIRKK